MTFIELQPWVGVDLDGTLAEYHGYQGPDHIGKPIQPMVDRVWNLLRDGNQVKIFTARADYRRGDEYALNQIKLIQDWLVNEAGLPVFEVTNKKDYGMLVLYDDRCIQVECNTGNLISSVSSGKQE